VDGLSLDKNDFEDRRVFIAGQRENLDLLSAYLEKRNQNSASFLTSLRSMSFWGTYPWKRLDARPKKATFGGLLISILLSPLRIIEASLYLIAKYFQYMPYKIFREFAASRKTISIYSPSHLLNEFSNPSINGFWGNVKYLNPSLQSGVIWCLVPFKGPNSNHRKIVSEIKNIQAQGKFSIYPLASLFDLKLLMIVIKHITVFQIEYLRRLIRLILIDRNFIDYRLVNRSAFGRNLARTELNNQLFKFHFELQVDLKKCLFLMEGQSWEISLVEHASKKDIECHGVIHTPIRFNDTQILNYFLGTKDQMFVSLLKSVLCPGEESLQTLRALGCKQNQLKLIEAQRFVEPSEYSKHGYSKTSKKILFVADANKETTESFLQQRAVFNNTLDYEFYIQPHPSFTPHNLHGCLIWNGDSASEWGLVIFGSETSSYLQPKFYDSNAYFFLPFEVTSGDIVPSESEGFLNHLDKISSAVLNPIFPSLVSKSKILRSDDFQLWKDRLNEIFSR
jgi:hypothetical protein